MPKGLPFLKQFEYQWSIIESEDDINYFELSGILLLGGLLQGLLDLINEELLESVHLALPDLIAIE